MKAANGPRLSVPLAAGSTLVLLALLAWWHSSALAGGKSWARALTENTAAGAQLSVTALAFSHEGSLRTTQPWWLGEPLDVVYTYLDTDDPEWQATRHKYLKDGDNYGTFPDRWEIYLSLARLHQHAPWVRRIYIASMGQQHRLDRLHMLSEELRAKIRFVDHKEFIPKEYLPTFSSLAIEAYLHRIPGISEVFMKMDDDLFLERLLARSDVFSPTSGVPYVFMTYWPVMLEEAGEEVWRHVYANAGTLLQRRFGRKATQPFLQYCWHAGHILTKRSYQLAWEVFGPELNTTASHRFRTYRPLDEGGDVSVLALVQHLALTEGLLALNAEYTYTVSLTDLELWSNGDLHRKGVKTLFWNIQGVRDIEAEVFKGFCQDVVAGAARAFMPAGRECMCADSWRVAWACPQDQRPPARR